MWDQNRRSLFAHARESGHPEDNAAVPDPRFRGVRDGSGDALA
jgi:hypothetical protein